MDALVSALVPAIEESLQKHLGSVTSLIDGRTNAGTLDPTSVLESLAKISPNENITEFLQSLATSALDPLDAFGRELVTHIATGVLLHTYLAGQSGNQLTQRLGKPQNQRAILDTPVLIALIGSTQEQRDAEATIRRAVQDGWNVVVAQHSIEELTELVEREIPNLRRLYREAHEKNARIDFYAALVDDQFHGIIISALQDGTYTELQQVLEAAIRLPQRLDSLGVNVREHGNSISQSRFDACFKALNNHLQHSTRKRSVKVITRDADSMTMAWRRRTREKSANWPGAWIITSDRAMNHAYSAVSLDRVAITLTLPQWTTVLSISAAPGELSEFASLAAGQFVDEAIWELPARFPKDSAMQLAAQLSPGQGGSNLDVYHAQKLYELPEMLDKIAENSSPHQLTSEVMAARARRLNSLTNIDRSRKEQQIASAYIHASKAKDAELKAQKDLMELERKNSQMQAELRLEQSKRIEGEESARVQKIKFIRVVWSIGFVLIAGICLLCTLFFGNLTSQLIAGSVLVGVIFLTFQWSRNYETKIHVLGWTIVSESLGALSAVQSLIFPQS